MKKSLRVMAVLGLLVLPLLYGFQRTKSGDPIQPTVLATPLSMWATGGNLTATQATLAVNARDYSAVWTDLTDAKTIKWTIPNELTGAELRFQTDANADAQVIEMWVAAGDSYRDGTTEEQFMLGATFTLTGGQQVAPNSNVFCDTMLVSEMVIDDGEVRDSGNDRVSVYKVDMRGYKRAVFIATTYEAASTVYLDYRGY